MGADASNTTESNETAQRSERVDHAKQEAVEKVETAKQEATEKVDQAKRRWQRARERWPTLDHLARMLQHYGEVLGSQLAGAVTYFGFLSFFPLIALAFAATGYVVDYVPGAEERVARAIGSILPGMVGTDPGQIDVRSIADRKAGVGIIGLLGLLYSGLGWVSALRTSLQGVFRVVLAKKRNFVVGKLVDLVVLGVIGLVLVGSVSLSTAIGSFTRQVVDWLGWSEVPGVSLALRIAVILIGVAASTLLFFTMYRLLPKHNAPTKAVWQGALIAALGFEVLKQLANVVIGQVTGNALYGAFAIMIALLVWINYFARLAVLGAAWAATAVVPEHATDKAADTAAADAASRQPQERGQRGLAALALGAVMAGWIAGVRGARDR